MVCYVTYVASLGKIQIFVAPEGFSFLYAHLMYFSRFSSSDDEVM